MTDFVLRSTDKDGADVWVAKETEWKFAYAHLCAWIDQGRHAVSVNGVRFSKAMVDDPTQT